MPYICVSDGRYIGEHTCRNEHYGNMTLVRPCCVEDAKKYKALVLEKAMTREHPAYKMFVDAWNALTVAEMLIVGDIYPDGYNNGFKER
jgi:hypothetical protein